MARLADELEKTWDFCRRIDFSSSRARLAAGLLEPMTSLLRAETAVFRVFSVLADAPRLTTLVSLGVPESVHDAYRERYFKLDPARRLLTQRFRRPLFADQFRRGEWEGEHATIVGVDRAADVCPLDRHRENFRRYRNEFLLPNGLCHHLGFCFQDASGGQMFLLNFHRPEESLPFNRLERARAKMVSIVLHAKAAQFRPVVGLGQRCDGRAGIDDDDVLVGGACRGVNSALHGMAERHGPLSARELEVAGAVTLGLTNKEVAQALSISVRTVENHMRSIFSKLQITTRTRLAARLHELNSAGSATLKTASWS